MILSDIISYLNSPEPVVSFQKLCGIEFIQELNVPKEFEKQNTRLQNGNNLAYGYTLLTNNDVESEKIKVLFEENPPKLRTEDYQLENSKSEISENLRPKFKITNLFFYYLFTLGAMLGEEIFYISFFPFWFWNVDGFVGRRLCIFWAGFMYLGQAAKDILRIPRPPSPPVVRLESKYDKEYGMPSTHAMVGAGLPFAIYFLTRNRYLFPPEVTLAIAVVWCGVVCFSRIYLGMHTILDVICGLIFVFALMFMTFQLNLLNVIDSYVLKGGYISLLLCVLVPLLLSFYYPSTQYDWSNARSDTFIILAVCSGCLVAHWLNYNLGHMQRPIGELGFCGSASTVESIFYPASSIHCNPLYLTSKHIHHRHNHHHNHRSSDGSILSQLIALHPPYPVTQLSLWWLLLTLSRTILGVVILLIVRFAVKYGVLFILGWFYPREGRANSGSMSVLVPELIQKYLTYCSITVIGLAFCPLLFAWLNIERETYFTEL